MTRILFLSTTDASQNRIAAAFAKARQLPDVEIFSAELTPAGLDTMAVKVMAEIGIALDADGASALAEIAQRDFAVVIAFDTPADGPPLLPLDLARSTRAHVSSILVPRGFTPGCGIAALQAAGSEDCAVRRASTS